MQNFVEQVAAAERRYCAVCGTPRNIHDHPTFVGDHRWLAHREQEDYAYEDRQDFIWVIEHPCLSLAYRIVGLTIMAGCAALVGWGLSWMVGR
jgi:hypothetical protein